MEAHGGLGENAFHVSSTQCAAQAFMSRDYAHSYTLDPVDAVVREFGARTD